MSNQPQQVLDIIEDAIDVLRAKIPVKLDERLAVEMNDIINRIKKHREDPKPIPEGKYFAGSMAKSRFLKDLRDLLRIFRDVLIPAAVEAEMQKLRSMALAAMEYAEEQGSEQAAKGLSAKLSDMQDSEPDGNHKSIQALAQLAANLAKHG